MKGQLMCDYCKLDGEMLVDFIYPPLQ